MITWVVVDVWFEFRLGSSQSRFRGWDGPLFSHALACQFDAVGTVDKAIEDRVGDSRISDDLIPALDGHLAGDDDRAPLVSILDDLEEVTALFVIELFRPPQSSRIRRSVLVSALSIRAYRPSPLARASAAKSRGAR